MRLARILAAVAVAVIMTVGVAAVADAKGGWRDAPVGDCSRIASTLLVDTHPGTKLARNARAYLNRIPDATWAVCWRKADNWWQRQDFRKYRFDRPGRNVKYTGWMS